MRYIKSFEGKINENSITEGMKKITKQLWKKMNDDKRFDALLSVVKDPDEATKYIHSKWEELPSGFERDMVLYESKLNKAVKLSYKDAGIKNDKDLKKVMDILNHHKIIFGERPSHKEFIFRHASNLKWAKDVLGLKESKLTEDYSQRARNFRVNLRQRLIAMKPGQKVSYGKAKYVKMVDGNFQLKGKVYGVEDIVQAMKHAVKPDILKHRGAAGTDMVNAYLKFEGKVNENFVDDFLHNNKANVDFYNALENLKAGELNKKNVLKLAKKYKVDSKEAIRFAKEMWVFEGKLNEGTADLTDEEQKIFDKVFKGGVDKLSATEKKIVRKLINQGKITAWPFKEGKLNEAEKYDLNFKKGDTIDLIGDTWEIIGDMKSRKKFKYPFTFRGEDMEQLPITAPSTSKNAEGYKVRTVEGRGVTSVSPMYGFLYQYTSGGKLYTKLAIKDVPQNESVNEAEVSYGDPLPTKFEDYINEVHDKELVNEATKEQEAIAFRIKLLLKQGARASVKDGEDKLYKLSQEFEGWNVDNDDKYDDLVTPLDMAVELVQDAGEPGKNNVVKDKEYYSYIKSADKHLKQFNKDCAKALKGLKESKLTEVASSKDGGSKSSGKSHEGDHKKISIIDTWKETYGEDFHSHYPAIAKILKQRPGIDKRELKRIWSETYEEDFDAEYPALWAKLD